MSFLTTSSSSAKTLKPCVICKGESCFVIPGIASPQCFCLLHYYTTGKHQDYGPSSGHSSSKNKQSEPKRSKKSSLLVDNERMNNQLPKVQELFAEAFVELREEIGEASARAFQKTKNNADDPLASLLADGPSSFKSMPAQVRKYNVPRSSNKRKSSANNHNSETEGGFIRETVLPEKLRKLQNPNINLPNIANEKPPAPTYHRSSENDTMNNPYRKRKKTSSIWHQILDSNSTDNMNDKKPKAKRNWDDMEKQMMQNITSSNSTVARKTCTSCKSTNIEIVGSNTSRNCDMTKGEVWGMKDRGELVVERCRCLSCGRIWNED